MSKETMTTDALAGLVRSSYEQVHTRVVGLVEELSADQLTWRLAPNAHSICWILWHVARRDDFLQATIPNMTDVLEQRLGRRTQIWESEAVASAWGLDPHVLGHRETGMWMDHDVACAMRFPDPGAVRTYTSRCFEHMDSALAAIDDSELVKDSRDKTVTGKTVGSRILSYCTHANRHMGQIEYLRAASLQVV
jgi:uncharacterized damage-inducible protein DinB